MHDLDIEIEAVDFYKFPNKDKQHVSEEEEESSDYSSDSPRMPLEQAKALVVTGFRGFITSKYAEINKRN